MTKHRSVAAALAAVRDTAAGQVDSALRSRCHCVIDFGEEVFIDLGHVDGQDQLWRLVQLLVPGVTQHELEGLQLSADPALLPDASLTRQLTGVKDMKMLLPEGSPISIEATGRVRWSALKTSNVVLIGARNPILFGEVQPRVSRA